MNRRPVLLDLFCGAGGSAMGYYRAGFDVIGVDIVDQPNYPFEFHQADALWFMSYEPEGFDAIHASPPCQAFTLAQRIRGNGHPNLIAPIRKLLQTAGLPYVIENVPGAPMRVDIELCGAMFDIHTYRHRWFESNIPLIAPTHPKHRASLVKMGRPLAVGDWYQAVGNFSGVSYVRTDMDVAWMTRDEIREAIPPSYAEFIGRQLIAALNGTASAPATPEPLGQAQLPFAP